MIVSAEVAERELPAITPLTGALIVFGTGVVFSFSGLAFRLTDDVSPWQYMIFRGLGAFITTVAIVAWRYRGRAGELVRGVEPDHVIAGLLLGLMSGVFIFVLDYTTVAFVLFLQTTAPLAAAYFSWLLMRERVSRAVLVATCASVIGVAIMVSATLTDRIDPLGLTAVLLPIALGIYATLIRRARAIDPQVPVLVGGLALAIVGIAVSASTDGFDISVHDALIGLFAGSALLAIPVAFMNHGARVVPAPETALLLMGEVVLAPIWVWIFVDEDPRVTTVVGGAIVIAAVAGLLLWRRSRPADDVGTA